MFQGVPFKVFTKGCMFHVLPFKVFTKGCMFQGVPFKVFTKGCMFQGVPFKVFTKGCMFQGVPCLPAHCCTDCRNWLRERRRQSWAETWPCILSQCPLLPQLHCAAACICSPFLLETERKKGSLMRGNEMTQTGCGWGVQQRVRLWALVPEWMVGVLLVRVLQWCWWVLVSVKGGWWVLQWCCWVLVRGGWWVLQWGWWVFVLQWVWGMGGECYSGVNWC